MPPLPDIPDFPLPTLDRLGHPVDPGLRDAFVAQVDAQAVAKEWLNAFVAALSDPTANGLEDLLLPDAFWRDMLALTWDFRTFRGKEQVLTFVKDRVVGSGKEASVKHVKLKEGERSVLLQRPFPDIVWVQLMFDFDVSDFGRGSAIVRVVPVPSSAPNDSDAITWKAHIIYTNLEGLLKHPEQVGPLRNAKPNHGKWEKARKDEMEFREGVVPPPQVIVIGAGQSGLGVGARLKALGVRSLIVERNGRIGDNWRNRYEGLCLHDPVYYDHMPYIQFPPTWPVYTPSQKLANWLEHYAEILELNVWLSSTITSVIQDPKTEQWEVTVKRGNGQERKFVVNHVVFATGLGSGVPNTPSYPGMDKFRGQIIHSSEHRRAEDHAGKKVVVIGACTSAHDIAADYYDNGIDVTMFQRSSTYVMSTEKGWRALFSSSYCEGGPPVDVADRISASWPHHSAIGLQQRMVRRVAELDKDLLESLHKVGFRTNLGLKDTGFGLLTKIRAGGYYIDTGASGLIAEGKIKLKSDSEIEKFEEEEIVFKNGSRLLADVVIFATGFGDVRQQIKRICGEDSEVAKRCNPIWGLNEEGEINGVWRDLGVKGLWYMMGNLAGCRFHSTHVALQIKAMEEGVFGTRYSRK